MPRSIYQKGGNTAQHSFGQFDNCKNGVQLFHFPSKVDSLSKGTNESKASIPSQPNVFQNTRLSNMGTDEIREEREGTVMACSKSPS